MVLKLWGDSMRELFNWMVAVRRQLDTAVFFFNSQDFSKAYRYSNDVASLLNEMVELMMKKGMENEVEGFLPILQQALEAVELRDEIYIADVYEASVLPYVKELTQKVFGQLEAGLDDYWGKNRKILRERDVVLYHRLLECRDFLPDNYMLNWANTGDLVLRVQLANRCVSLCSEVNPWREALIYTQRIVESTDSEYLVLGFGMGYHVQQLLWRGCRVRVLEHDLYQLAIALSYRPLEDVLNNRRLEIIYCEGVQDYIKYFKQLKRGAKCCIWYPSIKAIKEDKLRETLEDVWLENSSVLGQGAVLDENFRCNIARKDKEEVSCLKGNFKGKTMILAAGGPSLEDELEHLKVRDKENTVLVCVGKAAKKLIASGVIPDYIVMTDAQAGTRWQIRDIEDCGVPLIYLSTVAANVAEEYQGKKYIAFQKDFSMAEEYAKERGYVLYETGGSVSTFAIDMGIRMECSRIICVGLDLGYPGEQSHVAGIGHKIVDTANMRQVEGVRQKTIPTSRSLDLYRKWIEKRIERERRTEFINASKGARIHGMKEEELFRCLNG